MHTAWLSTEQARPDLCWTPKPTPAKFLSNNNILVHNCFITRNHKCINCHKNVTQRRRSRQKVGETTSLPSRYKSWPVVVKYSLTRSSFGTLKNSSLHQYCLQVLTKSIDLKFFFKPSENYIAVINVISLKLHLQNFWNLTLQFSRNRKESSANSSVLGR